MRTAFAAACTCLCAAAAWAVPAWPELPLPDGARAEMVAPDSVLNGRHSRIVRASVPGTVSDVLAFYRDRFGRERVENPLRDAQVIAQRQGDFFNTVQLRQAAPDRVEATLMTTVLAGPGESSRVLKDTQRLLPADSTLLHTMESDDGGRRSVMVTALNDADLQANRDQLVQGLQQRGFKLSREDRSVQGDRKTLTLWADSAREEATLTVIDVGPHRAVVVNRVREPRP